MFIAQKRQNEQYQKENNVEKHDSTNDSSKEKRISFLFTPDAEPILNKYATAIKVIGIILMVISFFVAIVYMIQSIKEENEWYIIGSLASILAGVITYIICIIIKAFIDVFVNISVTLQDINSKTKK